MNLPTANPTRIALIVTCAVILVGCKTGGDKDPPVQSQGGRVTDVPDAGPVAGAPSDTDLAGSRISTREDRKALVEYLIRKTMEREAFSDIKNRRLGLDVEAAMRAYEAEAVNATTEEELFYALVKLSNARRDTHLRVRPVPDGLRTSRHYRILANSNYPGQDAAGAGPPTAPIKFAVDYRTKTPPFRLFVADFANNIGDFEGGHRVRVGHVVNAVGGLPIADYVARVRPFFRASTEANLWTRMARALNEKTPILPDRWYRTEFSVSLDGGGSSYQLRTPYSAANSITWAGYSERRYRDFERIKQGPAFDLYRHTGKRPVLLLAWKRFGDTLVEDIDALVAFADANGYLDHDLIWDGTRSRGGGRGAYAIRHLSPKPFKTTFGNLRLSDITPAFVARKRRQFDQAQPSDGTRETVDDGTWLMDWLDNDVMKGHAAGQDYSNNVPFKSAHAPKWSDGVLRPARVHFRGDMVCLFGPYGGSHLDQFAAIVVDNDLCRAIGMPTGGYSNTWEWSEVVRFPISKQPVVEFMWSIGHTIRPNGEVLEGNPAAVHEWIPVTSTNYANYYSLLLDRALELLGQ